MLPSIEEEVTKTGATGRSLDDLLLEDDVAGEAVVGRSRTSAISWASGMIRASWMVGSTGWPARLDPGRIGGGTYLKTRGGSAAEIISIKGRHDRNKITDRR